MSRKTLKLDTSTWDLQTDSAGRLVVAVEEYATAQDVANEIRLFTNDAYLAADKGIPHFRLDLGVVPSLAAVRARYRAAALGVDNVSAAEVEVFFDTVARELTGEVVITTVSGVSASIEI